MNQNPEQLVTNYDWLKIDPATDIPANFNRIAEHLFNDWLIEVNENHYRLLEIEFYYKSEDHPDVYTHGHSLQTKTGYWYFHGSGVDLTFGSDNIHGGILIRSIEKIQPIPTSKEERYFFGPLKSQMELLNNFHPALNGEANIFQLVPADGSIEKVPADEIIQSTRIGLSDKREGGNDYHKKHYRYLIYPGLGHKEKTNIAEILREKMKEEPNHLDKIKKMLGSEFLKEYR